MTTISIPVGKGQYKEVERNLFEGYLNEALAALHAVADAQSDYKAIVETVSETTGLKKGIIGKYFKARFDEATDKTKELAQTFAAIDDGLNS